MKHFGVKFAILTIFVFVLTGITSQAAGVSNKKNSLSKAKKTAAAGIMAYSFADESHQWGNSSGAGKGRVPLGTMTVSAASASPGLTVGYTFYDYQQNCSMGRMIETGPHSGETGPTIVHMGWMFLPDSVLEARTYMYNAYKSVDHSLAGAFALHDPDAQYSGYVNVDVTPDNRALVGGHCDEKGPVPYQTQIHFDACPACLLFDTYERVPDSVAGYDQLTAFEATWPKFFFQFGTDTVLHAVAQLSDVTELQTMMYFRKVGYEGSTYSEWDYPPYVVDSVPNLSHDITGQRMGDRVAMAWMANLPYQEPSCDTCSGLSVYAGSVPGQMDNDVYYQISNDQGATWEPRVNVTQAEIGEAGYKAYCDLSILLDQDGYMHLVWHANPWPADLCIEEGGWCFEGDLYYDKSSLFHWSENVPYIRTIADHTYLPSDSCGSPAWAMTVAKPTISECDGKLYVIWSQFNDVSSGIDNDCAQWGYDEDAYWGATNAEIWVSMSFDDGMTWSFQRNLTNSYTPHCDPHSADDCQSDYWPSMSRWGRQNQTGEDWSIAEVVDPSGGGSPTDYYLDIMYVNDLDAGGAIWGDEGSWTNNPIKWFRMPCYGEPVYSIFRADWYETDPPVNVDEGESIDIPLGFENLGNVELTYTISIEEDNGPAGWLAVSGFSGSIPSGLANREEGTVHINQGGLITMSGHYTGRLHVEGNTSYGLPCDIEINLYVTDVPICYPEWDVVNTQCLSLEVSEHGNMGHQGRKKVNMDYYPEDCDSTATIYLYDGSPFLGQLKGDDTVFTSTAWGDYIWDDYVFMPLCDEGPESKYCGAFDAEIFESGTFFSKDSTVAFERIWVAPQSDCEFMVQYTRVWSPDGLPHDDLMLGEVIDWDIPWDYHADDPDELGHSAVNTGGTDGARGLIYQQGYEAYGAGSDTSYPYNCQYNDERFAGNAFIESYLNGSFRMGAPYGGFIGENDSLVYPAGESFVHGAFYQEAIVSGLRGIDSTEDLHTAMVYEPAFDLGADDVYEVVTIIATIQQGTLADLQQVIDDANAWYTANGGIDMFADDDANGQVDVCQGCCEVMGDCDKDGVLTPMDVVCMIGWMWRGGPDPLCEEELNVNCIGGVDPLDAVYLVYYFWRGGPAPCDCSELP